MVGSFRPVSAVSLLRSSTAVSESKPRSLNARPGSTAAAPSWPSTAAACVRTRSTSVRSCSPVGSPVSFAASALPASAPPETGASRARRASGTSESRALGRVTVNGPMNRSHSKSATVRAVSSSATACWSAEIARAGRMGGRPRRRSISSPSPTPAMPPSAQPPQETASAVRPCARRYSARASR